MYYQQAPSFPLAWLKKHLESRQKGKKKKLYEKGGTLGH
jgi:hypothetical protein